MSKDVENNTEKSLIEFVYKFVQNCLASKPVIVLGWTFVGVWHSDVHQIGRIFSCQCHPLQ